MRSKPTASRITPGEGGENQHIEGGEGVRGFGGFRGYSIESEQPSPEIPDDQTREEGGVQLRGLGIRFHLVIFGSALVLPCPWNLLRK